MSLSARRNTLLICLLTALLSLSAACAADTSPEQPSANRADAGNDSGEQRDGGNGSNQAPNASISAPSTAALNATVRLDGTASSDPNGDELAFSWKLTATPAGSRAAIWGDRGETPWFEPDKMGSYEVELTVDDGELIASATATVEVTDQVAPDVGSPDAGAQDAGQGTDQDASDFDAGPNQAPIADAGADLSVDANMVVTLDGTNSSDPNGDTLRYSWNLIEQPAGSASALLSADTATPRFTPTVAGAYRVEVTVSDGELSDRDTVLVSVGGDTGGNNGGGGDDGGGNDGGGQTGGDCLIISEYVEGSSNNKAVELYNCGSSPLALADYRYCAAQNSTDPTGGDACSMDYDLSGTLAAGGVQVLCNPSFAQAGACDELTSAISFNGNDRFVIYQDNGNAEYDHGVDTIVDAFGQLGVEPSNGEWGGVTLDRCNFAAFDGASSFDETVYYAALAEDDFTGLGVAPSETCAP